MIRTTMDARRLATASALLTGAIIAASCGAMDDRVEVVRIAAPDDAAMTGDGTGDALADAAACPGAGCAAPCPYGDVTTIEGKVYGPNGLLPIFNAIVYIPTAPLAPIVHGPTCDRCGAVSGDPVAAAITNSSGEFTLKKNVPDGKDVRLVVQSGKWRREVRIPEVHRCQKNVLADPNLTRLPKNQSEGDLPRIAVTTGVCDNLACLFPKLGVDASELGVATDGVAKSVHLYRGGFVGPSGGPPAMTDVEALWSDATKLGAYDMVLMSCECSENLANKGGSATGAPFGVVTDYLNAGGRILASDLSHVWLKYSTDPALAAIATTGGPPVGVSSTIYFKAGFSKGASLSSWWTENAKDGPAVHVRAAHASVTAIDAKAVAWAGDSDPGARIFSVTTPLSAAPAARCGRAVQFDTHLVQSSMDPVNAGYPASCFPSYQPAQYLLPFFLFELGSCIQDDSAAPAPPKTK